MRCSLVFLLIASALLSSCNQVFFQPSRQVLYRINGKPDLWEDLYFPSYDGTRLHARLFHSQKDSSQGLIVHFHGNAENLTSHFMHFFWVVNQGYDYLIFDYRGYGESEGLPSRRPAIEDGKAALQFAWETIPSAKKQLVVVGQSLGGALVVPAVAEWPMKNHIDLLILDATFDRYPTEARRVLSANWFTWAFQGLGWLFVSGADNPQHFYPQLYGISTLVTHCKDDRIVSADFAEEIYAQLPGPEKRIWTFPKCGHTGYFHFARTQGRRKLEALLGKTSTQPE